MRTRTEHLQRCGRTIGVVDPWAVDSDTLLAWFMGQPWKTETRRAHRSSFRVFYRWGVEQGHVDRSPALVISSIRPARPNPRPLPDVVYAEGLIRSTPRERLMLRLAVEVGMRRGEIAQAHWRDLEPDLDGWSLVVHGKGSKDRLVPVPADLAAELLALPRGWFFPGSVDGHLSARWVGKLMARLLPGDWTIHKGRHRFATRTHAASGYDVLVVKELCGWARVDTAQAYIPAPRERLRAAVEGAARVA